MPEWEPNFAMPAGSGERWVDAYEQGRPGYPDDAIAIARVGREATVVDVGAGTGKLTRLLAERFSHVVAVEPAPAMRRVLARTTPAAEIAPGAAEALPLESESADAVFSAEAFHHFDGARAVAEVARVLRRNGALVLLWNIPAGPFEPPIDHVERIVSERGLTRELLGYDPLDLNSPRWEAGVWRDPFADAPFEPLRDCAFGHVQTLTRAGLLAFIASMGWVADLPDGERLPLLGRIESLLASEVYRRPWRTHVAWTTRR